MQVNFILGGPGADPMSSLSQDSGFSQAFNRLGAEIAHAQADVDHLIGSMSGLTMRMPPPIGAALEFSSGTGGDSLFGSSFNMPFDLSFGQQSQWAVSDTGNGMKHIDLGNYTLDLNESNMEWKLTNKQTHEVTDISGDPHVSQDGNNWTFKNNLSFQLNDGTRITVHTTPYGNGATVSSELDVTKGDQGMKITGLGGSLDAPLEVTSGLNGRQLDMQNGDTPEIYEGSNNWQSFTGDVITDQYASQNGL